MTKELIELGKKFAACKEAFEAAKKLSDDANDAWGECETQLMEAMKEAGVGSISIDGVGRLTLSRTSYPSVNGANKPIFFDYLRNTGNEGLLKLDVATNTLTAFLKKHVQELQADLAINGLTDYQARCLATLPGYEDALKAVHKPVDEMDAEQIANDILKSMGATPFTKQKVSLSKK